MRRDLPRWAAFVGMIVSTGGCGCSEESLAGRTDGSVDTVTDSAHVDGPDAPPDAPHLCGNGVIEAGEECDDGPGYEWDGCIDCEIVEFRVDEAVGFDGRNPRVAVDHDGSAVVSWVRLSGMGASSAMTAKKYGATGEVSVREFYVSTTPPGPVFDGEFPKGLAMSADGSFIAIWEEYRFDPYFDGVLGRLFDSSGGAAGDEFVFDERPEENGVAMFGDGSFVIVDDQRTIMALRYGSGGSPIGSTFAVSDTTDFLREEVRVAASDDGRFVAVWESWYEDEYGPGIFGRVMNSDGTPYAGQFKACSAEHWYEQRRPELDVAPDGRFVVVWKVYGEGGEPYIGVYARSFDASGAPLGPEFPLPLPADEELYETPVAMAADGSFAIGWGNREVYFRRFSSTGSALGPEIQVNVYETDSQDNPAMDMTPDGRFFIAWESQGQEGDGTGIYAQRYDADGNPVGLLPW
jgi:cysteine-rich repeat protein